MLWSEASPASMPRLLKWWNPQESRPGPPCHTDTKLQKNTKLGQYVVLLKRTFCSPYRIIHTHHYIYIYCRFVHICSIYLFHSSSTEKNRFELAFRIIRQFHHYHPPLYSWTSEMNSYSHESNLDPSVHLVPKEIPEVSTAVEAWHMHLRRQTVVPGMGAISIAKSWRVKETRVYHRDEEAWYIVKYWYTFLYNGLCVCDFIILHAYSGKNIKKNKRFNELHRDIATPRPAIEVRRKEPQKPFHKSPYAGFHPWESWRVKASIPWQPYNFNLSISLSWQLGLFFIYRFWLYDDDMLIHWSTIYQCMTINLDQL